MLLTEALLNSLIHDYSNGRFDNLQELVSFVTNIENTIVSTINNIVSDNTQFDTFAAFLQNLRGLNREEIRLAMANAINVQRGDPKLLDGSTLQKIVLREIFESMVANESGDPFTFDTVKSQVIQEQFGKYFVEDD